jgi:hypothetical protein
LTGTTFSWVSSQNNVTGANAASGNLINQNLTLTGSNGSVVYTITPTSNGCFGPDITSTISVVNSPTATISYSGSPYCSGTSSATVTLTGTTGGTFSATTGLIINSTTGAVDLSSPAGNYTVTYTIAAGGGCSAFVVTTPITINLSSVPITGFSYATPVCKNGTNPVVLPVSGFTAGGTYTSTTGLSINSATGAIDLALSTPGSYTVTYIVPATICGPIGTSTAAIVIKALPTATASPSTVTICSLDTTNIVLTSNAIGTTYAWTSASTNVTGASSASGNSITDALTLTGTTPGTVVYTITPSGSG